MRKCKNYQHQKKGAISTDSVLLNLKIYMKCTNPWENTTYTNTWSVLTKCNKGAGGMGLWTAQERQAECLYSLISHLHNEPHD